MPIPRWVDHVSGCFHSGLADELHAEWARFRAGRGRVLALAASVLITVSLGLLITGWSAPAAVPRLAADDQSRRRFAITQSIPTFAHVDVDPSPIAGYHPLAPWVGSAETCGYAAPVLGAAIAVLHGRRPT